MYTEEQIAAIVNKALADLESMFHRVADRLIEVDWIVKTEYLWAYYSGIFSVYFKILRDDVVKMEFYFDPEINDLSQYAFKLSGIGLAAVWFRGYNEDKYESELTSHIIQKLSDLRSEVDITKQGLYIIS